MVECNYSFASMCVSSLIVRRSECLASNVAHQAERIVNQCETRPFQMSNYPPTFYTPPHTPTSTRYSSHRQSTAAFNLFILRHDLIHPLNHFQKTQIPNLELNTQYLQIIHALLNALRPSRFSVLRIQKFILQSLLPLPSQLLQRGESRFVIGEIEVQETRNRLEAPKCVVEFDI